VCENLMLPILSSLLIILLHLATLNMNLSFPFLCRLQGERAAGLALAGQTNSSTYNFSRAKRHSVSCVGDGML
jgi:hypothetical protein